MAIVVLHAGLLAWNSGLYSPTFNEPAHLASGFDYLQNARVASYLVNPPLVRATACAVATACHSRDIPILPTAVPGFRSEFAAGNRLIHQLGSRSKAVLRTARLACIPISLCGAMICFLWGRELFGEKAGLLSLILWCLDPTILGHGSLMTPDVAAAALGLAAGYAYWKWLYLPGWGNALLAGVLLGLAELTKFSWLPLFVLWPLLFLIHVRLVDARNLVPRCCQFGLVILLSLYVVNVAYVFSGTLTPLGKFDFVSQPLTTKTAPSSNRFKDTLVGRLPVPLPYTYVLGIDQQLADISSNQLPAYLFGEWSIHGWWYYYFAAFLVKWPLGTLILAVATTCSCMHPMFRNFSTCLVMAPPVVVLLMLAIHTGFDFHFRYALPTFGFLFVLLGGCAESASSFLHRRHTSCLMLVISLLVCEAGCAFPNSIAYFNPVSRLICHGQPPLMHSNLDWGQGLYEAQAWLRQNAGHDPVYLSSMTLYEPADLGIAYLPPAVLRNPHGERELPDGWHLVSMNLLYGQNHAISNGTGGWNSYDSEYYALLKGLKPVRCFGDCMFLYRVARHD